MGVFGININTLYSKFWSLKEVFSASNKAIGLYNFITAAPGIRKAELGALYTPNQMKTDSSHKAEKISKDLKPIDQLTSSRRIMTVSFRLSLLRCSSKRTGTQS